MEITYEWFKEQILLLTGINLNYYKERQMKRRIEALMKKNNFDDFKSYINALKIDKEQYTIFINYITINVSEFYRNPEQWEILKTEIITPMINKNIIPKIWSAACSTGDEPYTLAMIMDKISPSGNYKIVATDIDSEILNKAKMGIYSEKSMECLPLNYVEKYFIKEGAFYKIKDEIKKRVEFKKHDLLKDDYPTNCDIIVCRNVLIYFTDEAKSSIYQKFNKALKENGILFIGSTEQVIMPARYGLKPIKTFFYKKENEI